jgi:two-component system phosphate regulon sensor histidine kinase PhoR
VTSLDRAQAHLDAVVRQMPDGLLVLASNGVIVRANAAAEHLLGLPADKILGRTALAVLMSYAVDREVSRVLEGERGGAVDLRLPDGRALRVAVGALWVREGESGAVVLLLDTTELRRTDDMRRDFVANVSHELRTPVAAIRAMVETLLLRGARRPELIEEYVPRVVLECERIDRLVSDLLLLAQTEAGQLRLQLESLDPREVAAETVQAVEPLARSAGTQVVLDGFAPAAVRADRFALGQCVRNLVDNALRYAPGGTVRLGSRVEGSEVILSVSDTGPGIPPEDVARIFERFYRVDKARARESEHRTGGGSGLGLSIVRHLAEVQGGRAWVESRVGEGSTFCLALPLAAAP